MGIINFFSPIFNLYTQSTLVLFLCLGWMITIMFETFNLHGNIRQDKILRWKGNYLIILELVNQIKECFTHFLLILITTQFARMIMSSFHVMTSVQKSDWKLIAYYITIFVVDFISFIPLIYIPHRIKSKV